MQRIKLFAKYDSEALFSKISREIHDHIRQWPAAYFSSDQAEQHRAEVKNRFRPRRPEISLTSGTEMMMEKIYPRSQFQPGAKPDRHVRINVLVYKFDFKGEVYLLGCRPAVQVPEPPGEWFVDQANKIITLEYIGYEKSPRKTLALHREYLPKLMSSYETLLSEFDQFDQELDSIINRAMDDRKKDIETMNKLLSTMRQ